MPPAWKEETLASAKVALLLVGKETEHVKQYLEEEIGRIESEGYTEVTNEGWKREFEINGKILRIAFIHGRKGEHKSGADVVFERKGNKLVVIQSKKVGSNYRIHFDRFQHTKLKDLEARLNYPRVLARGPPGAVFVPARRAAYYQLTMSEQGKPQDRMFHVLEVDGTLGNRKSCKQDEFLDRGLTEDEFHNLFEDCAIGAWDINEQRKRNEFHLYSLVTSRLVIWLHLEEPKTDAS